MAQISPKILGRAVAFSQVPITPAGDTFENDGGTFLHITNGGGTTTTITVTASIRCNHGILHTYVTTVVAGATKVIGPFLVKKYGLLPAITYSGNTTSVTIATHRNGGLVGLGV